MALSENRGSLVGGLVVSEADEIMAIKNSGQVTRSQVAEIPVKGRSTMGVKFVAVKGNDAVSIIALNPERDEEEAVGAASDQAATGGADGGADDASASAQDGSPATAAEQHSDQDGTVVPDQDGVATREDDGE